MLVIRGSKTLRDRVPDPPPAPDANLFELMLAESTTELGDWFATVPILRPQIAMLVNVRTLATVVMPLAPAATFLDRVPAAIAAFLRRQGATGSFVEAELAAMQQVLVMPTNNPSVVGSMNGLSAYVKQRYASGLTDLLELSLAATQTPQGLKSGVRLPDRELAAIIGGSDGGRVGVRRVAQLRIDLQDVSPPIWRRVLVDATATLDEVHTVIQAAFGWSDIHLHDFTVGSTTYTVPEGDWLDFGLSKDERTARLDRVVAPGSTFRYTYDFGDGWEHTVKVERVLEVGGDIRLPACVGGRRACPPEDCGGPFGYQSLLDALADPANPHHLAARDWTASVGRADLDPEAFDDTGFDERLALMRSLLPEV